jgi:hypothetical protein
MLSNGKVADGNASSLAANAGMALPAAISAVRLKASRRVIDMITSR